MSEQKLYCNGVSPKGKYLTPPMTVEELVARVKRVGLDGPPEEILDDARERSKGDPRRRPILDAKRKWDLAETGWAVVYAPGLDPRVKGALEELLEQRRRQATASGHSHYFRECTYQAGEQTLSFLKRVGAGQGARGDPDFFPYYVLLAGDPESLPYKLQQELDVSYAVGRICFKKPEHYRDYARSVVAAEDGRARRPRRLGFFAPAHENDPPTQSTAWKLVKPLAESIAALAKDWEVRAALGPEARKERLRQFLGGAETPALLFAAGHGLGFPAEDERLWDGQGSLVCQEWRGPDDEAGVGEDQCFAAADVAPDASFHGLIAFFVACYGAGTPARDNFDHDGAGRAVRIAPRAFASRLPQRLLSHPNGALAVVGHVDRAWLTSFEGSDRGEGRAPYLSALRRLLEGHTVGWALEDFSQMYAAAATQLGNLWEEWKQRETIDENLFADLWRSRNDARNYVIFGDPAVRLPGVGEPR